MFSRIIKYFIGLFILCAIQFICNCIVKYAHIIIPSPILGIILFAFLLKLNIIKKDWVKDICNLLLKYMPLLFVPLFVGIISYYSILKKNLIPIAMNVILTTTITLIVTAIFVENVIKFVRLHKIRKLHNG